MSEKVRQLEYGFIQDEKIYLKGFLGYPDRKIGQVKESEEASIKYFEDRFQLATNKVNELEKMIVEAQNKGSYLMKLVHMRKYLANFDGLGDYTVLFAKLDELEEQLRGLIAVNRVKNYEIKTALLKETETIYETLNDPNAADFGEQLKEIKQKWIKTGAVIEEHADEIEQKFEEMYRGYFGTRKEMMKDKARQARDRIHYYRKIIFAAEDLKNSDNFDQAFQEFRNLQNHWKNGGKIPHRKATEMWEKFKKANDWFFTRYKKYKAFKDEYPDVDANVIKQTLAAQLAKEAEALVNYDRENPDAIEKAKELLMEWKKITGIFRQIDYETAERFRIACDKVFEFGYLIRVVKRKYPDVERKPKDDQYRIKISFMRELIRKDEAELSTAEANLERMNRANQFNKAAADSLNIQKRKVKVKKQILKDLEEEFATNKK
jgi:hypothetical protein